MQRALITLAGLLAACGAVVACAEGTPEGTSTTTATTAPAPQVGSIAVPFVAETAAVDVPVLAALDPDGSDLRQVIELPGDMSSTPLHIWPSRDGTQLLVSRGWRVGADLVDLRSGEVRLSGLDGLGVAHATWSHEGTRIAITLVEPDERSRLAVVNAGDGEVTELTGIGEWFRNDNTAPATWSAGDELIGFGSPVHVLDSDDGAEVNADLPGAGEVHHVDWSPDGARRVVWMWPRQTMIVERAEGGGAVEIGEGYPLGWSPDGARYLTLQIVSQHASLIMVSADGATTTTLWTASETYGSEDLPFVAAAWSPTSDALALMSARTIALLSVGSGARSTVIELDTEQGWFTPPMFWAEVDLPGTPIELPTVVPLGEPGSAQAIDLHTGAVVWTAELPGSPLIESGGTGPSIAAGPDAALVMVGRAVDPNRAVVALSTTTGALLWTTRVVSPQAVDANVVPFIVATGTGYLALDPATGTQVWRIESTAHRAGSYLFTDAPGVLSRLAVGDGSVARVVELCDSCIVEGVLGGSEYVVVATMEAVDPPTLSLRVLDTADWSTRWTADLGTGASMLTAISGDEVIVLLPGSQERKDVLLAFDAATGREVWRRTFGEQLSRLAASDRAVVVTGLEATIAVDRQTGATIWTAAGGYAATVSGEVLLVTAHHEGDIGTTHLWAYDAVAGGALWDRTVPGGPREVAVAADLVIVAMQ